MLNNRDKSLVKLLSGFGFLTSEQIKKILFQEVDKRTMLRRLRKLKKKKILNRFESAKGTDDTKNSSLPNLSFGYPTESFLSD